MNNIKGEYCYKYPHAAITADCVIFGFDGRTLNVLLVERGGEPYKGMWALPGGFMRMDETVDECAARELAEETNLRNVYLEQFKVFSDVKRDPRERVVTVAYIALVRPAEYQVIAGDDAVNAMWFNEAMLPPLAFDHGRIIQQARQYIAEVIRIKPIAFNLLDETFTAAELQRVYESISHATYDRRNFLRKAMHSGAIVEADEAENYDSATPTPTPCAAYRPVMKRKYIAEPDCAEEYKSAPSRGPRSRRTKLFSFRGWKKDKPKDDSEDASLKDIFNF